MSMNPGNSGGPVLGAAGEVIGIADQIATNGGGEHGGRVRDAGRSREVRAEPLASGRKARGPEALAALAGVGLTVTIALTVRSESLAALGAAGGPAVALGRLTGMLAAYAMLLLVLLAARLPPLERVVGQDRLIRWHSRIGPWPIVLVAAHGALITIGYAQQARTGALHELGVLVTSFPGVLAATAGFGLLVLAGLTSYRRARRRMAYETWWAIHLYLYLALGLSFSHQVATGAAFAGHLAARAWWIALWAGTGAAILLFRLLVPMHRSLRHRLVVEAVEAEAPGVVSVVCRGRALDRLPVAGGQFLQWRFLTRGLWWQAHPYSLSGLPRDGRLRLTVKALGDHSAALARLRPGTRVAVEGPYGAFTKHARVGERVLLFGAGSGIAPLHPLLEDLPPEVDAEVILRASTERDVILRDELAELAALRGARVHELIGPRERTPLGAGVLRSLVPDVASRDVYVCGPSGLATAVARAARACGVSDERIHLESFAF